MEYQLTGITIENLGSGTDPVLKTNKDKAGNITGGSLTLYPGNSALITVTNTFHNQKDGSYNKSHDKSCKMWNSV